MKDRAATLNFALAAMAFALSLPASLKAQSAIETPAPQPGTVYSTSIQNAAKEAFSRYAPGFASVPPAPQKFKLDLSLHPEYSFARQNDNARFLRPSFQTSDGMKEWANGMTTHWTRKLHLPSFSIDDKAFRLSPGWRLIFGETKQIRLMKLQIPPAPGEQRRPYVPGMDIR